VGKFIDLTGQRFGRLTVIRRTNDYVAPGGATEPMWLCICDCGNETTVKRSALKGGHTKSCGCFHSERISKLMKKQNPFTINGEKVYVCLLNSKSEMVVDKDTWFNTTRYFCWSLSSNGYAKARIGNKSVYYHVFAFPNCPDGMERDHIDGNRLNNCRTNIRFVTRCNNNKNRKFKENRKSGKTGVNWSKSSNKWRAIIKADGKYISLGYFVDLQDAIDAREAAEIKYFGEYRRK